MPSKKCETCLYKFSVEECRICICSDLDIGNADAECHLANNYHIDYGDETAEFDNIQIPVYDI